MGKGGRESERRGPGEGQALARLSLHQGSVPIYL
jgi:hypothetical protein